MEPAKELDDVGVDARSGEPKRKQAKVKVSEMSCSCGKQYSFNDAEFHREPLEDRLEGEPQIESVPLFRSAEGKGSGTEFVLLEDRALW